HVPPRIIRGGPTPRVEFALNVEKPGLVSLISLVSLINGVHRSFLLRRKTTWHLIPFAMWPGSPRTTTGSPPPHTAITRLRRVSRSATDRRLCVGSDVPINNPWTHR